MTNLIPFESAKLPASIAAAFNISFDDFSSGQRGGFPVISIKGKVFHIKRGEEKVLVTKPDAPDEPAASIEVVVIKTHPGVAKTYYVKGFTEGNADKPDCYSNDGVAPAADAQVAQAKKCANCPHNQWGSKITEDGKKAKACADVKRLAVAPAGQLNDPMLLRVPAASLKSWDAYVDMLKKRGVPPPAVITKIGFDYTVAHPALTFKPMGILGDAESLATVKETMDSDTVQSIIGGAPAGVVDDEPFDQSSPAKAEPEAPKPRAAAKPKADAVSKVVAEAEATPEPTRQVKVEAEEPAPKAAAKVVEVEDSLADELDGLLGELGFDDDA